MIWPIGTKFIVDIDGDERMWILGKAHNSRQTGIDPASKLGQHLQEISAGGTVVFPDSTGRAKAARIIQIVTIHGTIRREVKPKQAKKAKKVSTKTKSSTSTPKKCAGGRPAATGKGPSPHAHYTTHCWKCKSGIDSASAEQCQACGWYKCRRCGACGCRYQA